MANQTNYKRTVAGSVGAGMGAIFNGSGRTYYILEHKTNSQYHSAGESQKIIIDQIELGRDSSCQVRFDESFDTVSRKHAAIVRDGQNWQLIHLSTSNPTLVNGRPIEGSYYLQSGDEIQLSVGGPRMGFIVPQGKQALTSSIKLTERMNLFRQQALAPYRRALWALGTLLVLVIAGFGYWNWNLTQENKELMAQAEQLLQQNVDLDNKMDSLDVQIKNNPENAQLKKQMEELKRQKQQVQTRYTTVYRDNPALQQELTALKEKIEKEKIESEKIVVVTPDNPGVQSEQEHHPSGQGITDVRDYYSNIYRIIIDDIKLQYGSESHDAGIATENVDCGTGFILDNGNFITARQNIQPWINVNGISPTGWRERLAKAVAMGFDVIIHFSAYSTNGPSSKITFSSRDFDLPEAGDIISATYTIDKNDWIIYKTLGFSITKEEMKRTGRDFKVTTSSNRAYAIYRNTGYSGLPANNGIAQSIAGGEDIKICGYTSNNIHNLSAAADYHKTSTKKTDTQAGNIRLQDSPSEIGYLGAPAFVEKDGTLQVVGVYVGQGRLVPIGSCK